MKFFINVLRTAIFLVALYEFFAVDSIIGIVLAGTGLFSFLFGFRSPLLIKPSTYADYWEFCGVLLILANASILTFFGYNGTLYGWLPIDVPMHIWGGVFAGFWAELALDAQFAAHSSLKKIIMIIGITALVGVVWECFEWAEDHTIGLWFDLPIAQPNLNDTMSDLVNDLIGGIAVVILWNKWKPGSSEDSSM